MFENHNTKAIYEKKVENRGERSKMRERERERERILLKQEAAPRRCSSR